jgi:hypothetical protein
MALLEKPNADSALWKFAGDTLKEDRAMFDRYYYVLLLDILLYLYVLLLDILLYLLFYGSLSATCARRMGP